MSDGTLDEIVTGLALADGPAFRGDLARVLDRDSETIRQAIEAGLAEDVLHLTGGNRVALTDPPTEEELLERISADELAALRRRWMRVHRFRSWAQEQVTKASRTGVGVVFTDDVHILPNAALCRLVDDWTSPEAWFNELLAQKRTPEPRECAVCGAGEILGDTLVELEAPNGHEKTFAITFYGHCHETDTAEGGEPPLLFAVRLRKERSTEPSTHPVLSGSTSDTGLDLAVSFPNHGDTPNRAPGMHTLDNILVSSEKLRRRIARLDEIVGDNDSAPEKLKREMSKLTDRAGALRDDIQYTRDITRLTSTVRALRSIFESNWTFRDVGGRTVSCLGAVMDVDQLVLLMHGGDDEFEVIGFLEQDEDLPEELTTADSKILERVYETGESVSIADTDEAGVADDVLAVGRTLLALPIKHGDNAVGALFIGDEKPGGLTEIDVHFLEAVANPIGEALHSLDSGTPFTGKTGIDEVTGVFNQTRFFDNAAREFIQARSKGRDLSALVFAIDDWDRISQEQNASATDEILRTVVERSSEALRGSDFVGRYAQATFTALLIDVDLEIARKVADRIRAAIHDDPINVGGAELQVTVSIGAAMMTPNVRSADRLVSLADSAMMKASDQGGDQLELASTPSTPQPV